MQMRGRLKIINAGHDNSMDMGDPGMDGSELWSIFCLSTLNLRCQKHHIDYFKSQTFNAEEL